MVKDSTDILLQGPDTISVFNREGSIVTHFLLPHNNRSLAILIFELQNRTELVLENRKGQILY
jgi:hypothetical protein